MTPAQLVLASGADRKWIQNARRILGRPTGDGASEARWLGLVHELHTALGCALAAAARVADAALAASAHQRELRVPLGESEGRAELVIDLWRDQSIHLARLSVALVRPIPERRGRPSATRAPRRNARARAAAYGVDVDRLRAGLSRTPAERLARLDENIAFLTAGRGAVAMARERRSR